MKQLRKRLPAWLCMAALICGILTSAAFASDSEKKSQPDGYVIVSVEAGSIGYGYLLVPTAVPFYEGETAAQVIDRALTENGLSYQASGTLTDGFYLSAIGPGGVLPGGAAQAVSAGAKCQPPKRLGEEMPAIILQNIQPTLEGYYEMDVQTVEDLNDGWTKGENTLSEFDYCPLSGWMTSVNNVFPSDYCSAVLAADGDVLRVQYSMAWGMDIGAGWGDFYPTADKTDLCKLLAQVSGSQQLQADAAVAAAYAAALAVGTTVDASQGAVKEAKELLENAIDEMQTEAEETPVPTGKPSGTAEDTPETGDVSLLFVLLALPAAAVVVALRGAKTKRQ